MSELKATPGPWEFMNGEDIYGPLGGDSGDGVRCDEDDGWKIAEVGLYSSFTQDGLVELGEDCRKANARLISAAPELYTALESCKAALMSVIQDGAIGFRGDVNLALLQADYSLSKARGE